MPARKRTTLNRNIRRTAALARFTIDPTKKNDEEYMAAKTAEKNVLERAVGKTAYTAEEAA